MSWSHQNYLRLVFCDGLLIGQQVRDRCPDFRSHHSYSPISHPGWALSVKRYKEKLLDLVQQIYLARLHVLPCNMAFVTDYLDGSAFKSLDTLLRSTQPFLGDHDSTDPKLTSLVTEFDEDLESRLLANLKDLKFNLSSVDKVTLVSGPGRIERVSICQSDA